MGLNFAHFQQFCHPGSKGNYFSSGEEVPRCEAACARCFVREERISSCSHRAAREASMMSSRATLSVLVERAAATCAACFVFASRLHLAERQLIIEVRKLRCSHDALVPSL